MAWKNLPTNYKDAVWNGLKRYLEVNNDDGTVSFEDVTQYTNRENSFFGAKDANQMNEALNVLMSMVENGTDLYTAFREYFTQQQAEFAASADEVRAEQEQEFNVWLESVNSQLSGDVAGNLLNLIEALDDKTDAMPTEEQEEITLSAAAWVNAGENYTQIVNLAGVKVNERIDLYPNAVVLTQLMNDGVSALYVANNEGVLTAYSLSGVPTADLTVQAARVGIPTV